MKTLKDALIEKGFKEKPLSETEKESLNSKAYDDVLMMKKPSLPENNYYIECYNFWSSIAKR